MLVPQLAEHVFVGQSTIGISLLKLETPYADPHVQCCERCDAKTSAYSICLSAASAALRRLLLHCGSRSGAPLLPRALPQLMNGAFRLSMSGIRKKTGASGESGCSRAIFQGSEPIKLSCARQLSLSNMNNVKNVTFNALEIG